MAIDTANVLDILTRTLWGEARDQGELGMTAVANVIITRSKNPRWWGTSILTVCLKPWQFSSWNPMTTESQPDENYKALLEVDVSDPQFVIAKNIAIKAVNDILADVTKGADSYFATYIKSPVWAIPSKFTVQIGQQKFYRAELPPLVSSK